MSYTVTGDVTTADLESGAQAAAAGATAAAALAKAGSDVITLFVPPKKKKKKKKAKEAVAAPAPTSTFVTPTVAPEASSMSPTLVAGGLAVLGLGAWFFLKRRK